MPRTLRRAAWTAAVLSLVVLLSLPARQPAAPTYTDGPATQSGPVAGVPVAQVDGALVAVTAPSEVRVAVSPWVAWRFGPDVLRDAQQVLSGPDTRLRVRYVRRLSTRGSTFRLTSSGMQVGECALTHGFATYRTGDPVALDDGQRIAPVVSGRIRVCGNTYKWPHAHQVALLVHETAHLLGVGHTCHGRDCGTPDAHTGVRGCEHLMAGAFSFDCPVDPSSLDEVWATLYPTAGRREVG